MNTSIAVTLAVPYFMMVSVLNLSEQMLVWFSIHINISTVSTGTELLPYLKVFFDGLSVSYNMCKNIIQFQFIL
jgi:hypothetical protein